MQNLIDDVTKFHVAMGQPVARRLGLPPYDRVKLRAALIVEEAMETICALTIGDKPGVTKVTIEQIKKDIMDSGDPVTDINEVADGLIDLIYVAIGCGIEFGLPMQKLWDEVQASNMSKVGGGLDENGKVKKGPNFFKPRIGELLDLYA